MFEAINLDIGFSKNILVSRVNQTFEAGKIYTIIGDIRDGKGIEILVKSWRHIDQKDLKEIFFILPSSETNKFPDESNAIPLIFLN